MFKTPSYSEVFSLRANLYHEAMQRWPNARDEEFTAAVALAQPLSTEVVLDIPAGGGYLSQFVIPHCLQYIAIDPAAGFIDHCRQINGVSAYQSSLTHLCLPTASVDLVMSVVGLHHETVLAEIFSELARVTRPTGRLLITEVAENTNVATFLNGFVDSHNPRGHQGRFLDIAYLEALHASGWSIRHDQATHSYWRFEDAQNMVGFFRLMFDLSLADDLRIEQEIRRNFQITENKNTIGVLWPLRQLLADRKV